jgi:hypothetical protein
MSLDLARQSGFYIGIMNTAVWNHHHVHHRHPLAEGWLEV